MGNFRLRAKLKRFLRFRLAGDSTQKVNLCESLSMDEASVVDGGGDGGDGIESYQISHAATTWRRCWGHPKPATVTFGPFTNRRFFSYPHGCRERLPRCPGDAFLVFVRGPPPLPLCSSTANISNSDVNHVKRIPAEKGCTRKPLRRHPANDPSSAILSTTEKELLLQLSQRIFETPLFG